MTEHTLLFSVALAPYLTLALVDGWMHEKSRRVPMAEQCFHAAILVFIGAFIIAVFLEYNTLALAAMVSGGICLAIDEFKFHGGLPARERMVHYAADLSLGLFSLLWLITVFTS